MIFERLFLYLYIYAFVFVLFFCCLGRIWVCDDWTNYNTILIVS
jgi:hypothetical protein